MRVLSRIRKAVGLYLRERWNCREFMTWAERKSLANNQWWMQLVDRLFFSEAGAAAREQERIVGLFAKCNSGKATLRHLWSLYHEEYGYSSYGINFSYQPGIFVDFVHNMCEAGMLKETAEKTTEPMIFTGPERRTILLYQLAAA